MAKLMLVAVAALLAVLPIALAERPIATFAVMGDWGWGDDGDYYKTTLARKVESFAGQKAVARAMGEVCAKVKCKFVINTGDNFYNLGIDKVLGVKDPQWETSFNQIYSAPSLQGIKFYGVLGNHEYGIDSPNVTHSIYPQLEYTAYDPNGRWHIPQRYYDVTYKSPVGAVRISAMDTSPFNDGYCSVPTSTYYTKELLVNCQEGYRTGDQEHMARSLAKARADKVWSIAVGHHPLISSKDGPYHPLNDRYAPILAANPPHLWFNGHDHILGHQLHPNLTQTNFFTIGASGIAQCSDLPSGAQLSLYQYTSCNHGFGIVKLYKSHGIMYIFGVTDIGTAAEKTNFQYKYTFSKF